MGSLHRDLNHRGRTHDPAPRSSVATSTGLVGFIGLIGAVLYLSSSDLPTTLRCLVLLAFVAGPMAAWELFVLKAYRNPSTGLDFANPRPRAVSYRDTAIKLVGLWSTWAIIGFGYWVVRWFESASYDYYFILIGLASPGLIILSIPYVLFVDRHMREPHDGLWHMGRWVTGRWSLVDKEALRDHARAWFIKAFFLGFMISIVPGSVSGVTGRTLEEIFASIPSAVSWMVQFLFLIDIAIGAVGYILTFRVLDSHIRSANPHLWAWVVAFACYPPFAIMGTHAPLDYRMHSQEWIQWFEGNDVVLVLWGAVIVLLTVIYAWATMIFGIRFSNLTHRGIITNGPFRLFKHPAYLSKSAFWWMVHMPFLSVSGPDEAVRNCALLVGVNVIYFLRARTEEKHLMADPEYQRYSAWIAEHGVIPVALRRLGLKKAPAPQTSPAE